MVFYIFLETILKFALHPHGSVRSFGDKWCKSSISPAGIIATFLRFPVCETVLVDPSQSMVNSKIVPGGFVLSTATDAPVLPCKRVNFLVKFIIQFIKYYNIFFGCVPCMVYILKPRSSDLSFNSPKALITCSTAFSWITLSYGISKSCTPAVLQFKVTTNGL